MGLWVLLEKLAFLVEMDTQDVTGTLVPWVILHMVCPVLMEVKVNLVKLVLQGTMELMVYRELLVLMEGKDSPAITDYLDGM